MCFLPGFIAASVAPFCTREQVQPAGVDLRVAEVHEFVEEGLLGVHARRIPKTVKLEPHDGKWVLRPGCYKLVFEDVVEIPEGCVGLCFPRSSLLRMGATLLCAVWDPGYRGRGSALLCVFNPHGLVLEVGARVAQLVVARVVPQPRETYAGAYQYEGLRSRGSD